MCTRRNHENILNAQRSARENAIATAKKCVDVAVEIACPSIRPHIRRASSSAPNLERAVDSLLELSDYAAGKNVAVHLENDDLVSEDAFFLVKVIEGSGPYQRALHDFANSLLTGDADFN
jgi:sugar phosphate isomerase/epimerase